MPDIEKKPSCWQRIADFFRDEKTHAISAFKIVVTLFALFLTVCIVAILVILGVTGKLSKTNQSVRQINNNNLTSSSKAKNLNASLNSCGYSSSLSRLDFMLNQLKDSRPTIIRGLEARPHSMPWIVSLRSLDRISNHFCAGSLITREHVLTAAHCVYDRSPGNLALIVGLDNLNSFDESNLFYAESYFINENYGNLVNDIALIKLTKAVDISDRVNTICLTNQDDSIMGTSLVAAGWGDMNSGGQIVLPSFLQQTTLKIINDDYTRCSQSSVWSQENSNFVLCAINDSNSGESNVCLGDSGGPLVGNTNGVWYLYGIVSYVLVDPNGSACLTFKPSYFTRVSKFYDWVANKLSL